MIVYLPTIKQLQYLVALEDTGHFGKAAESCFVTQSTLSASLRELESLVGVTLVARNRRVLGAGGSGGSSPSLRWAPGSRKRRGGCFARRRSWPTWRGPPASP